MFVCLMDIDSKIPNLCLMKLSTYHKQRGDRVKLGYDPVFDKPDLCYASKMFTFTPEPDYWPDCEIIKGGPAYSMGSVDIPDFDRIMPDYSLYPNCGYALGRFSRGCPNRCPWCVVWKMDGNEVRKVADLADFHAGQRVVRLLDDNIMANEPLFLDACEQLYDAGVSVIWDALDIRLVNDATAYALATVKPAKGRFHFAWDGKAQDGYIRSGIETLERNGIKPWRLVFYVLVGFGTSREYDMHRITTLDRLGANPFVMPYDKGDPYQKHLARWCNNKIIFRKTTFEDYYPWVKERKEQL